jgi:hypothetical protein
MIDQSPAQNYLDDVRQQQPADTPRANRLHEAKGFAAKNRRR